MGVIGRLLDISTTLYFNPFMQSGFFYFNSLDRLVSISHEMPNRIALKKQIIYQLFCANFVQKDFFYCHVL